MKLSIIVTHYKEPAELCIPLFESIRIQRGIDFEQLELIIVDDGRENGINIPEAYLPNCNIVEYAIDKCGVSACRNFGLDHASGDYVMFCDCDDRFCNGYGLKMVFSAMDEFHDAITSCFIEEHMENGMVSIVRRENECTFVHGKAYRRKYLLDNNLRFHPELTIHEDGFFNSLALMCASSKKNISTPFYSWCYREGSVANRSDKLFLVHTYTHFLAMRDAICAELKKRNMEKNLQEYVSVTFFDAYYALCASRFTKKENAQYREDAMKAFRRFHARWRNVFSKTRGDVILKTQNQAFLNAERITVPKVTFSEFLEEAKVRK